MYCGVFTAVQKTVNDSRYYRIGSVIKEIKQKTWCVDDNFSLDILSLLTY